uniref:Uncharacterized protein n=1 Tax=Chrysotila carterae TaxID=13221 RepID=A0A6S9VEY7_CHRCT|mmetsp:Transcript_20033/g.42311  ORF Transcript_20033/g.42311 Transcript_20033/m.42311 type:complete len:116 (+) Transcript_20033:1252-1599(+)
MEGTWFSWCSPQIVICACYAVGFLGDRLDPSQIYRSQFVDRYVDVEPCEVGSEVQIEAEPEELEEVVKTPPEMRSGSNEALQAKLALAIAHGKSCAAAFWLLSTPMPCQALCSLV